MQMPNKSQEVHEPKQTKNKFFNKISKMDYQQLIEEQTKVRKLILESNALNYHSQNPYDVRSSDGKTIAKYNPKILRYMNNLLCQKLTKINNKVII